MIGPDPLGCPACSFFASTNRIRRSNNTCFRNCSSSAPKFPLVFSPRRASISIGVSGPFEVGGAFLAGALVSHIAEVHGGRRG